MSEPLPENQPAAPAASPPAAPAAPVPSAPAAPPPRSTDAGVFNAEQAFATLNSTLAALPEKLVNGVREAGQAAAPAPVVNPPEQTAAKRRTFGDWWFGNS